jgi:DNA-binding NarL/FixJ family response regulator
MKLLLADDHEMIRLGLKAALAPLGPEVTYVEADNAEGALAAAAEHGDLDLVLIDINMPGMGGVEGVRRLRTAHPSLPLIVCSAAEDAGLVKAVLALGASGFIPKSDTTKVMLQAIQLVLAGGTYVPPRLLADAGERAVASGGQLASLTTRQRDVLRLLAEGKPNKLIARGLDISESTVKVHLLAVFRALGARNRTEAVVIAQRLLAHREEGGAA